jgi:hypothetical protein
VNGRRAKYIRRQVRDEMRRRIRQTPIVIAPTFWQRVRAAIRRWRQA